MAVCQPAVPCLAATAVMASRNIPNQPLSLTMMGGPIDTRRNPTVVNELAEEKPLSWFEQNVISHVPFPNPGFMPRVYPGFIQLTGFMTMNLERHREAHWQLFDHLVEGDDDSVAAHERFYDEYLAVMDLPAEFYLQTIQTAFQSHALPKGTMMHRDERVDCSKIPKPAIITIEGENDDICGIGQTEAAHVLCTNVPEDRSLSLRPTRRRPLRRLQRPALAHRNPAAPPRPDPCRRRPLDAPPAAGSSRSGLSHADAPPDVPRYQFNSAGSYI